MPKVLCKPHTVIPIWKLQFEMGRTLLWGFIEFFQECFFTNFCYHIKDSKWGRKWIFLKCVCYNGSPQQIPPQQFPFTTETKPHYHCRAFWAISTSHIHILFFQSPCKTNQGFQPKGDKSIVGVMLYDKLARNHHMMHQCAHCTIS